MRKFFLALFFLTILVLLWAFLLDGLTTRGIRRSRASDFGVWNDLFAGRIDADIVIYGASRAWRHFDPRILEDSTGLKVYNLGIDGYNFNMQYYRHLVYLQHNHPPRMIVLSLNEDSMDTMTYLYNPQQFMAYLGDSVIRKATKCYQGFNWADYHLPLVRFLRGGFIYFGLKTLIRPAAPDRYKGFAPIDQTWNGDFDAARALFGHYTEHIDSGYVALFRRFVADTRARGIDLVFVFSPEYIEGQHFIVNRDSVMSVYRNVARDYDIPFYDYSADSLCQDKRWFYNAEHMNRAGTEVFSREVASALRARLAAATPAGPSASAASPPRR